MRGDAHMVQVERRASPRGPAMVPAWYWLLTIALVLWAAMGCWAWYQQYTHGPAAWGPEVSGYDRALYASLPHWYVWVYAAAVFAGLAGAVALLARSRAAQTLFLISLIAVLVMFGWMFASTDIIAAKGFGQAAGFPIFITVLAAFQVWFAGWAAGRGWLK